MHVGHSAKEVHVRIAVLVLFEYDDEGKLFDPVRSLQLAAE
jgi:hypothetical protein